MIYHKERPPLNHNRYEQHFEYMFILSNGKPNTFNPILEACKLAGGDSIHTIRQGTNTDRLGKAHGYGKRIKPKKIKSNIWHYNVGLNHSTKDKIVFKHPAIFPESLAHDHIISWTNEGDIVLDCLAGSGTTLKLAEILKRRWYGIEINNEYCSQIATRMQKTVKKESRRLSNKPILC